MFGLTDIRCLLGIHAWEQRLLSYRTVRFHEGFWTMRQECKRCEAQLLIEGPAAEIKGHIRSR